MSDVKNWTITVSTLEKNWEERYKRSIVICYALMSVNLQNLISVSYLLLIVSSISQSVLKLFKDFLMIPLNNSML